MSGPDRLTCEDLFRRLDDYLDRQLDPREVELVKQHLETCAVCAGEYKFEASVLSSVREKLRHIQAPPDLMAKIAKRRSEAEGK